MTDVLYQGYYQFSEKKPMELIFEANLNLYTYTIPMGYKTWDLVGALIWGFENKGCLSDEQFVEQTGKIVEDVAYLAGKISGIELKYNKSKIYEGEQFDLSEHLF